MKPPTNSISTATFNNDQLPLNTFHNYTGKYVSSFRLNSNNVQDAVFVTVVYSNTVQYVSTATNSS